MGKKLIIEGGDFASHAINSGAYTLQEEEGVSLEGCYFDLEYQLGANSKIVITFTQVTTNTSDIVVVAGVRNGSLDNQFDIRFSASNDSGRRCQIMAATTSTTNPDVADTPYATLTTGTDHTIEVDLQNNTISVDDTSITNKYYTADFDSSYNLYIGAYNDAGTINTGFAEFLGLIHKVEIYEDDVLTKQFIAALDSSDVECLVETIGDTIIAKNSL